MPCLNPKHDPPVPAKARGLCPTCYAIAAKLIKAEQTTWEKLEQEGKAIKPSRGRGEHRTAHWFLNSGKKKKKAGG